MFRRLSFIVLAPNRLASSRVAVGTTRRRVRSARERQFGRQRAAAVDVRQPRQDASATVDLKVRIEPRGANAGAGTVAARLCGPFESQGADKLPKFAFNVELTSGGRDRRRRARRTPARRPSSRSRARRTRSPTSCCGQFVAGYEQALKSRKRPGRPRAGRARHRLPQWLNEPAQRGRGAGRRRGDDQGHRRRPTSPQVIADLDKIAERAAPTCPARAAACRRSSTPEQKQRATEARQGAQRQVYTGADDQILRRLTVTADLKDTSPRSTRRCSDVTFTKVGEEQAIKAPANARRSPSCCRRSTPPASPTSAGASPNASPSPRAPQQRGQVRGLHRGRSGDRAKARKCAELLSG